MPWSLFWVSETDKWKRWCFQPKTLTIPNCSRDRPQLGKIGPGCGSFPTASSKGRPGVPAWYRRSCVAVFFFCRRFTRVGTCPNSSHHLQQILQSVQNPQIGTLTNPWSYHSSFLLVNENSSSICLQRICPENRLRKEVTSYITRWNFIRWFFEFTYSKRIFQDLHFCFILCLEEISDVRSH